MVSEVKSPVWEIKLKWSKNKSSMPKTTERPLETRCSVNHSKNRSAQSLKPSVKRRVYPLSMHLSWFRTSWWPKQRTSSSAPKSKRCVLRWQNMEYQYRCLTLIRCQSLPLVAKMIKPIKPIKLMMKMTTQTTATPTLNQMSKLRVQICSNKSSIWTLSQSVKHLVSPTSSQRSSLLWTKIHQRTNFTRVLNLRCQKSLSIETASTIRRMSSLINSSEWLIKHSKLRSLMNLPTASRTIRIVTRASKTSPVNSYWQLSLKRCVLTSTASARSNLCMKVPWQMLNHSERFLRKTCSSSAWSLRRTKVLLTSKSSTN